MSTTYDCWSRYYYYRDQLYFALKHGGKTKKQLVELQKQYNSAYQTAKESERSAK